jgi:Ca2+-binding EF-hand superfamily protein
MDTIERDFKEADANKDGHLDVNEFQQILSKADHNVRALPATAQV